MNSVHQTVQKVSPKTHENEQSEYFSLKSFCVNFSDFLTMSQIWHFELNCLLWSLWDESHTFVLKDFPKTKEFSIAWLDDELAARRESFWTEETAINFN